MVGSSGSLVVATLDNIEVDYGGRRALGPFSLDLQSGEITALVGPSGCGKSTALRLLAGLERPTRGEVVRMAARGETSVVFQAPTLTPWATALDNVALPLELAGATRAAAHDQARAALTRVGLAASAGLKPAQLSGGMAMRVSLARALVTGPRLLLLDEPFSALDEITRRRLADDVLTLWTETKPAVLFVTHSVEDAVYMAARIVVMTPSPGQLANETRISAPIPRREHFRTTALFRDAVEQVSAQLEDAMGR